MTTAMRALSRPPATASIRAWRLLPRPEIKTPMRGSRSSRTSADVAHAFTAFGDGAEPEGVRLARRPQAADDVIHVRCAAHQDQSDAHVERTEHIVPRHASGFLQPFEDRRQDRK